MQHLQKKDEKLGSISCHFGPNWTCTAMQLYTYMQKLPNRVHTGMLHIKVCVGQQACNSLMVPSVYI